MANWIRVVFTVVSVGFPSMTASPTANAAGPERVSQGSYHCVFFSSGSLSTIPGFSIRGSGYRHEDGSSGSFSYDPAQALIQFQGGSLDGQAGQVQAGQIHLYNERRSRTVADCDTQ